MCTTAADGARAPYLSGVGFGEFQVVVVRSGEQQRAGGVPPDGVDAAAVDRQTVAERQTLHEPGAVCRHRQGTNGSDRDGDWERFTPSLVPGTAVRVKRAKIAKTQVWFLYAKTHKNWVNECLLIRTHKCGPLAAAMRF